MILGSMSEKIKTMKKSVDSPEFDWLDTIPFLAEKEMIVYYTPRWPLMVFYAAAMFMFGFSAIYHLFNAKSKKEMTFWIRFDYAGICIMIAGSSTAPIYYGFACP